MQVETTAVTYVTLRNGVRFILQTGDEIFNNGRQSKIAPHFRFVGTKGLIEFRGWSDNFWICNADHPAGAELAVAEEPRTRHQRHLERMLPEIAGQKAPDYRNAEASLMSLEICEAAYLSANHQVEVKFPLVNFSVPEATPWTMGVPYSGAGGGRDGRKFNRS